jgi:hypothetical protein
MITFCLLSFLGGEKVNVSSPYWLSVSVSSFQLLNQLVSFHEICYEFMTLEGTTKVLSNFLQHLLIQSGSTNSRGGSSTGSYSCIDTGVYFPTAAQFVIPFNTITNVMHRVQQHVRN